MAIKQVAVYETTDGNVFDTLAQAEVHQAELDAEEPLRQFIEASGKRRAQVTLAIHTIRAWELFKTTGQLPAPVEAKQKKAA